MSGLEYKITTDTNSFCIVTLIGKMNAVTVTDLKKELQTLNQQEVCKFIIDLEKVTFIDSSGLSLLVSTLKNAREKNGFLRLVNIQEQVKHVFSITLLDRVFEMYNSIEEAVKK